jgi:hypothetical protein
LSKSTGRSGAAPASKQGSQASRALLTTLSLLLVAAAVQLTAVAPSAVRWLIVAVLLLFASVSGILLASRLRNLDPTLLDEFTNEHGTILGAITYYATRSVRITAAAAVLLFIGSGIAAYWSYRISHPPTPNGSFVHSRSSALSSSSGQFLVSLQNVQNASLDLVWFELAVPEYASRYAQTYLYYYTQASAEFNSSSSYDAIVEISNYGNLSTTDVVTAFACSADNTHIEAGASHPQIRKQAGCYNLAHICVQLPPCQQARHCAGGEVFALPPECKNQSPVWVKWVAPLP